MKFLKYESETNLTYYKFKIMANVIYTSNKVKLYVLICNKHNKKEIMKSKQVNHSKQTVQSLLGELTLKHERGFSSQNLWFKAKLYEVYLILSTVQREFDELIWIHISALLFIDDNIKRQFLLKLKFDSKLDFQVQTININLINNNY